MFSFLPYTAFNLLSPIRTWLDAFEVKDLEVAKFICKVIPADCPFARTIAFGNRTLIKIPPLCKLNPLYDQLVGLRFRALIYLSDSCSESCQQLSYR